FPGYTGEVKSFKIDGAEIEMGVAFVNDEGIDGGLRLTICNKWNNQIDPQPVDNLETLGEFSKIEITFVAYTGEAGGDGGDAAPAIDLDATYNAEFGAQFDDSVTDVNGWEIGDPAKTTFKIGEDVSIAITFDEIVKFGENYAAINTDVPFPGSTAVIKSLKLDGAEIPMGDAYINGEGMSNGLRLTICNKWNSDITEQPLDVATLDEFTSIEIIFTVYASDEVPPEAPEKVYPDFDPNGTYNAFLGVQSQNWIFRNAWEDSSYGADGSQWDALGIGNNFNKLSLTDPPEDKGGAFTDVVIKGNGTYQVSLSGADFGNDEFFNQLFVSTDISLAAELTFTNIAVRMNGVTRHTFEEAVILGENYYQVGCINIWNSDLGGDAGLFGYAMPVTDITIEFTVSGFAYDNEDDAPTPPPADNSGGSSLPADYVADNAPKADDGGFPGWLIAVIIGGAAVIAGGAAFLVIKSKKK
ncbi:MAG: hypothetical protein FWH06_03625, partial [Oscillospiraceae bacterium]|nr:hypothetical protein [Oscillospiraceae bacterium]